MMNEQLIHVVALGFSAKDLGRIRQRCMKRGVPVKIIDGQCCDQGSNCVKHALVRLNDARIVLWRPERMRHLPSGCLEGMEVLRVHGVSSAIQTLTDLVNNAGRMRVAGLGDRGDAAGGVRLKRDLTPVTK